MITVTLEEQKSYAPIIDAILATANLETITRKNIIKGLESSVGGKDLSEQKVGPLCPEYSGHTISQP